jgi:hypothetical protein
MLTRLGPVLALVLAALVPMLGCSESRAIAEVAVPAPQPVKTPGPRAEGQGFVVEVKAPTEATVGKSGVAKVVLRPTGGYKVNKEFPTALAVTAPAGADVAKAKMLPADAVRFAEEEAVFDVAFTCNEAGDKHFEATFKFAVCTTETCDPKTEKLAWTVPVK